MRGLLALTLVFAAGSTAHGRVFNFKHQTLSSYLRGTYGMNKLQKYAFEPGTPTSVSFSDSGGVNQAYSAEFGLGLTTIITTRLGVELLYPQLLKQLDGRNAGGTALMNVTSETFVVIPQINFELPVKSGNSWKLYGLLGAGYAIATVKNTVNMTSAGTAAFGVNSYIEEGSGFSIMAQGGFGLEFSFFDNVSMSVDLGYRYLTINNYTANRDAVTTHGQVYSGNALLNNDGSKRTTDLSGPWAGLALRFYIN